jgi:hypothetical protein
MGKLCRNHYPSAYIEAKAGVLVMSLVDEPMTLGGLLAGSPKKSFRVLEEDQDWIDAKPRGREI